MKGTFEVNKRILKNKGHNTLRYMGLGSRIDAEILYNAVYDDGVLNVNKMSDKDYVNFIRHYADSDTIINALSKE